MSHHRNARRRTQVGHVVAVLCLAVLLGLYVAPGPVRAAEPPGPDPADEAAARPAPGDQDMPPALDEPPPPDDQDMLPAPDELPAADDREMAPGPDDPPPPDDREMAPEPTEQPAEQPAEQPDEEPTEEPARHVDEKPLPTSGIVLNFRDAPLSAVLDQLSEVGGLVIVEEAVVQGRVTVMSRQPLTIEEAVSLLNTVLADGGFAAVRSGRVLKIVTLEAAKKMAVPVRSGADPRLIPATDDIVTQIIPLKYADAVQVRSDLANLIATYAEMTANASSNAIILTDTSANVRRIVEIIQALDTHMATVAEVRVFPLKYAEASDAARLINELFEDQGSSAARRNQSRTSRMQRFFRGPGGAPGQPSTQNTSTASRAPSVVASADDRTNTLVVSGPSDTLVVVAQVIEKLDANPAEEESVLVYRAKNNQATTISEVLNNLFSESRTSTSRTGTSGRTGRTFGRSGFFGATSQTTTASQAAGLTGNVFSVADEETNTLLVLTAPSNFERLRAIIEDLDRPVPQVLIKVLIAEVTHTNDSDLGGELSILNVRPSGRGSTVFSDFDVAAQSGGLIYKLVEKDVTSALRILSEVGKLDVLSRPYILTSDNQAANITVGQEVPFIRNTRTTETGQTINTIEYEDIGIILNVTPHINPDGLVVMDVAPEISTLTAESVPISDTVDAPVFAKRSAESKVAIQDGQTIVIGGLMEDRVTDMVRKVPILGDIPILSLIFSRRIKAKSKTELLVFLTPHVAQEPTQLKPISEDELGGVKILPNAVGPGAFREHMEGMARGHVDDATQGGSDAMTSDNDSPRNDDDAPRSDDDSDDDDDDVEP